MLRANKQKFDILMKEEASLQNGGEEEQCSMRSHFGAAKQSFDVPCWAADAMATCSDGKFISLSSGRILITE